jgi:hypothetical protein
MSGKIITAVAAAILLSSTTLTFAHGYGHHGYGAQPACHPVASWTNVHEAICIKYVCAGGGYQIRCLPAPVLWH